MATAQTHTAARLMLAPSVIALLIWMIVPLSLTLYFSTLNYNLFNPAETPFIGLTNYKFFLSDPAFFTALRLSLIHI